MIAYLQRLVKRHEKNNAAWSSRRCEGDWAERRVFFGLAWLRSKRAPAVLSKDTMSEHHPLIWNLLYC